jgi:uncharacterized OB-fold protein
MGFADDKYRLKPFRQGLFNLGQEDAGHLIGNQCGRCNITFFPSRRFCSSCFKNDQMNEIPLSKTGILYTYTIVYQGKPNLETPYAVGYVDLKDGVRIFAPLFDVTPEDLKVGMAMELDFRGMAGVSGNEETLVYGFRPAEKMRV